MNYLGRLIVCFVLFFIIYQAFQVLTYQKNAENFLGYNLTITNEKMKIDRKKREEAYKKLGTPTEWYKFKNEGYSYLDPRYWKVPQQYQPVCYDEDDTFPAPIMSAGTDNAMFYNPGKINKSSEQFDFSRFFKAFQAQHVRTYPRWPCGSV